MECAVVTLRAMLKKLNLNYEAIECEFVLCFGKMDKEQDHGSFAVD